MEVPERPLDPGYAIAPLGAAGGPGPEEVIRFWEAEGALAASEARHRVEQVLLVATESATGNVAGVASAYLQGNVSLRTDCWYYRVYVAPAHRRSNVAVQLAVQGRDLLEARHRSGEDRRAAGIVYEVENTHVMHQFRQGVWPQTQFAFIGEDQRGAHHRIRYFPGATVTVPAGTAPAGSVTDHMTGTFTVEAARRGRSRELDAEILGFWEAHGALTGEAARERLAEVVCVARNADGAVAGVCSVFDAAVPLIGGRRFWVYRRFAPELPEDAQMEMIACAYEALEAEHGGDRSAPLGLCVIVDDVDLMRRHPEAVWPRTRLFHAGYLPDGRQVRLRYFPEAHIA